MTAQGNALGIDVTTIVLSPEGATQLGSIPRVSFVKLGSVSSKQLVQLFLKCHRELVLHLLLDTFPHLDTWFLPVAPFQGLGTPADIGTPGRCPGLIYDAPSGRCTDFQQL
jgi:hypothetical protein